MSQTIVQGEYYFRKQEMVAGFNFSVDGRFQFFFSYGAVDRSATGTFSVAGDTIKLKSDKQAGKDFTVTDQVRASTGYTIKFEHPNKYLLTNIRCSFFVGTEKRDEYTNSNGEVHIDLPHCDKIFVYHELYPDIVTLVKDEQNNNHKFTLTLNSSLEQVSFKGIDLKIENDSTLTCLPNYFMQLEGIEFVKL